MSKAVKVLNLFSTLLFAGILLLVYSFLPISVDLNLDFISNIHKQQFFYYVFLIFILLNFLLRVILRFGAKGVDETLYGWLYLLIFIVNFYMTLLVGFVGVLNNTNHINPSSYAYLNYMGPLAVIAWFAGYIFLLFKKMKTSS
jgi:hypothetical protein